MSINTLQKAVFATTAYFDLFDYALSVDELQLLLLGEHSYSRDHLVRYLTESPKFETLEELVYFPGRQQLVSLKKQKIAHADELWQKTYRFARILSWIPCIKAVFVCNTLAYNNPHIGSDIDLFIIAKKNRLFLARTLVTLVTQLSGQRRYRKKIAGRFCLSFFISETTMNLYKIALKPRDIYLAYWVKTLRPIIDRNCLDRFEAHNTDFIRRYFPGRLTLNRDSLTHISRGQKIIVWLMEFILQSFLFNPVEKTLQWWQLGRAEKKRIQLDDNSGIVLSKTMLKFHNIDRRSSVLARWNERLHRKV